MALINRNLNYLSIYLLFSTILAFTLIVEMTNSQFTSPGAYYVFAPGFNFNPVKRGVPEPEPIVLPQNLTDIVETTTKQI
uniref:Uncharacterized protein n=2 Tax=Meloidogyne incognita group TaxID=654580 RepID=A0A914KY35_MELIC